jgi:C-terminal processing protease CtpA/Prc
MALSLGGALMLASCGGGGGGGATSGAPTPTPAPAPTPAPTVAAGCSLRERQDWALAQLQEWYLFPTLVDATVNPASYTDVQSYIDALLAPARAQNKDRYFTYLTSIAQENAYYQSGSTAGFGLRLGYDTTGNRVFVIEAFEGGPGLAAGIDRGAEITQINGQSVATLMASGGPYAVIDALGPDTAGTSRMLTVKDPSGTTRTVTISKTDFALDPVSNRYGAKVITDGATKVGYINLRTFIDTADPDLRAAFADFKAQGVTQLIVDLRYNGGGLVSIAELFDNLMGLGRTGQVMSYTTFRDTKSQYNDSTLFAAQAQSIAPTKVAFIGTRSTASASELTMNAMLPYLGSNMALVGTNTYGKPVGQIALDRSQCDDRFRVIAFKTENANHQGEYFNGLATVVPVTCKATDDISHQLGDPAEGMVKAALDYLAGRSCTAIPPSIAPAGIAPRGVLAPQNSPSTIRRELPGAY